MPFTPSTTARRAGRLLAAALVPVALGAACGGGDAGSPQAGAGATTPTTAAAARGGRSGQPAAGGGADDWCDVLVLIGDKVGNEGEGAVLTYPQLVARMKSVQPIPEAAAPWTAAEAVLAKPGFDPMGPSGPDLIDPMFTLAQVAMLHCPSS